MKRFLKVGDASSKMVWQPGSRQVEMTAVAATRGSFAATIVPKKEPKLVPLTPIFCASTSCRRSNQSTTTGPASIQFYTKVKTVTERWPSGIKDGAEFVIPTMR